MGDRPQCPEWMEAFLERQTDTITQVLDKHLSRFGQHESPPSPPKKKSKSDNKDSMPQDSPNSHPQDPEDDDDTDSDKQPKQGMSRKILCSLVL